MSEEEQDKQSEGLLPIDEHEEIVSEDGRKVRRRGIYLLPNMMTLGALFSGFYAIIAVMSGNFNEAGWAIFIAGILDGLDGRIARLTNTQSAFGAQFDSLSDMVSFGVAPALIMFSWAFEPLGRLGWAASFIYMSCAALRLARFNVQLGTVDRRFFVGLQSPMAAAVVAFLPWAGYKYGLEVTPLVAYLCAILTVFIGFLMISNYSYSSFKELQFKGTVPYMVFVFVVIMLVVVAQNPHEVLLTMAVVYALSGPIMWAYKKRSAKDASLKVPIKESVKKASSSKKAQTVIPKLEKSKKSKNEEAK
jgi:CDP-diacylglycerol--serine O-phosphatidyltransferase|tara:strand:- start:64 stop:978 length:915 start_codon:yes stop_codon:yes gene_type:complete